MEEENRPVFRISESNYTEEFYGIYDELKEDFLSGMKIMDIKEKYDLTNNVWRTYRKELKNDGLYDKRNTAPPKYITYNKGDKTWRVIKTIKSKSITYLTFKEKRDALKAVKLFKKYGWDVKNRERIRMEILNERGL